MYACDGHFQGCSDVIQGLRSKTFSCVQGKVSHTSILDTVTLTAESGLQSCADRIIVHCSQPELTGVRGGHTAQREGGCLSLYVRVTGRVGCGLVAE